jgi:hypothetical protein
MESTVVITNNEEITMERMKTIHRDELPERCLQDIHRFFQKPYFAEELNDPCLPSLNKNPNEYIILASKEKTGTNYSKWQTSFLRKSDIEMFKKYNPDYSKKYFVVNESIKLP